MTEEEVFPREKALVIQFLTNFLVKFQHKKLGATEYERALLLLLDIKDEVEKELHRIYRERKNEQQS